MLFVGDDWAADHHDVEIVNEQGRRLARRRLPEGLDGITRLHALIGQFFPEEWADLEPAEAASRVKVGIETERGPWVQALIATCAYVARGAGMFVDTEEVGQHPGGMPRTAPVPASKTESNAATPASAGSGSLS
jgi:hypothetical protein